MASGGAGVPGREDRLFALVDCNSFYAACERVFAPSLAERPVVVLSNNDGNVIARTSEVKALRVPMGAPFHQYRTLLERNGVVVFSSNYPLYGDMSRRVMAILADAAPDTEVYSIDEAFQRLDTLGLDDPVAFARSLRERVRRWTGIPVSIGLGPTKVLAKLANRTAKRSGEGVADLRDPAERAAVMAATPVGEIWGVGSRLAERLGRAGVTTAADLAACDPVWARRALTVVGERLVRELQGVSCLDLETAPAPRQAIMVSRSFGTAIAERVVESPCLGQEALMTPLATFAARAAAKARGEGSLARAVQVFLATDRFRPEHPQHHPAAVIGLDPPTADTAVLIGAVRRLLMALHRPGYAYRKAGVMLLDLMPGPDPQGRLLDEGACPDRERLMATIDALDARFGRGTVRFASQGVGRPAWAQQAAFLSRGFTTRWSDVMVAKAEVSPGTGLGHRYT